MKATLRKTGWMMIGLLFVYIHGSLIVPLFQDEVTYSYGPGLPLWQWLVCLGFGVACNVGGMVTTLRPVIGGWARWPIASSLALGAGASAYWLVQHFAEFGFGTFSSFFYTLGERTIGDYVLGIGFSIAWILILFCYFLILWSYSRRAWGLVRSGT